MTPTAASPAASLPFPASLRFADVDPAVLDDHEPPPRPAAQRPPEAAWSEYLARLLPPVAADPPQIAGASPRLRTVAGMADFLLSLGRAQELAAGLGTADRSGFWDGVRREIAELGGR